MNEFEFVATQQAALLGAGLVGGLTLGIMFLCSVLLNLGGKARFIVFNLLGFLGGYLLGRGLGLSPWMFMFGWALFMAWMAFFKKEGSKKRAQP